VSMARLAKGSLRLAARNLSPNCVKTSASFRPNFRFFSASSSANDTAETIAAAVSNIVPPAAPIDSASVIEGISHIESASSELGFSPSHIVMQAVEQIHLMVGIPYWEAIVLATVALRVIMLPLAITSVQNAARMSTLRPAMQAVKDRQARHPNGDDPGVRTIFEAETRQLFIAHKVNPLKSLAMPIIQLPIFISLYFGLRDMGLYFPGYSTGGDFWFADLTAADPYFIFPLVNALSFLVMIELGSDGIQTENQGMFKWVRSFLSCGMLLKPLPNISK
jgi:YidC/Oxa1 family membrane protein insertase